MNDTKMNKIINNEYYNECSIEDIINSYCLMTNTYESVSIKESQKFRYRVPIELFIDFLNINCIYTKLNNNIDEKGYYNFNREAYKRASLNGSLKCFLNVIIDFYFKSKSFYVEQAINYNKFLVIIRHLTTFFDIKYEKIPSYFRSIQQVSYNIYY